jgi:hypothetical protein
MTSESFRARKSSFDPNEPVVTIRTPDGTDIGLSLNEYRLAMIGLVDFDGDWAALQTAAAFVVDGEGKKTLIRERLLPLSAHLQALLARGVDSLELLAARHWFRSGQM